MNFEEKRPPRKFLVGRTDEKISISDCGDIYLDANEQVTMISLNGKRHDFVSKEWGFYATPSVNGRLKNEGFKTALVQNSSGQIYIMVVDKDSLGEFERYCTMEKQQVLEWLDERKTK